jgi:hypothetical protein
VQEDSSWIFVVGVAVEKIHDDLQHWFKKAYFFAIFATKVAKPLCLQFLLSHVLDSKPVLPGGVGLLPVVAVVIRDRQKGRRSRFERRVVRGL